MLSKKLTDNVKIDNPKPYTQDETYVHEIGGTTYIVTRKYKQDAKEGLMDKLLRLIRNDLDLNS